MVPLWTAPREKSALLHVGRPLIAVRWANHQSTSSHGCQRRGPWLLLWMMTWTQTHLPKRLSNASGSSSKMVIITLRQS
jgi:hypothetical protein